MSARNNLIGLVSFCSGILGFILFCKYISLFFNRKTDVTPFLMSKNWMIFAIVASAISIFALVINMLKDRKNLSDEERKADKPSIVYSIITAVTGLMTLIAFPLYLSGVISESSVITFTKILVAVDVISFMIIIAYMCCLYCSLCCVGVASATEQSAVKDDQSVLNFGGLNFEFIPNDQNLDSSKLSSNDNQKLTVDGSIILEKADQKYQKISRSMSVDSSDLLDTKFALEL
jgi:MFS family permease